MDQKSSRGGGIFVAVTKDIISTPQPDLETDCEIAWVKIEIEGSKTVYTGGSYHPHTDNKASLEKLKESVSRISNRTSSHVWIGGG